MDSASGLRYNAEYSADHPYEIRVDSPLLQKSFGIFGNFGITRLCRYDHNFYKPLSFLLFILIHVYFQGYLNTERPNSSRDRLYHPVATSRHHHVTIPAVCSQNAPTYSYSLFSMMLSRNAKTIMAPTQIILCGKSSHVAVGVTEGIRPAYEGRFTISPRY